MRDAIVDLSLRAWEPVFASIETVMDPAVFRAQHPDWRASQRKTVEESCADTATSVWVALENDAVVGFAALTTHTEDSMGEIYLIAVDPDHQRQGVARALTEHSLEQFRRAGLTTVMVDTGGDPGHLPARRTYEAAGFRELPISRYFKAL